MQSSKNIMHQSFATTSPRGPGNSGDIDFSICKAQVKSLHCRDFVLVKSLLKVLAPGELLPDSWALRKPQILNTY